MSEQHQFEALGDLGLFIKGGNAIFTVENGDGGMRYTYRASSPRESDEDVANPRPQPLWVSYLTGPDNTSNYSYLGTVWPNDPCVVRASRKSPPNVDTNPAKLGFEWLMRRIMSAKPLPSYVKVYHMGRCGRCGRVLTTPESVKRGFGPECWSKM